MARGTANAPLNDTDCGVVLNRRRFPAYGPDGEGLSPLPLLKNFRDWILPQLYDEFPDVTCMITKRALLFEFHQPLEVDGECDPSVDLIIGLDRREAPGLWIPNIEKRRWDPSHPQGHTELFVTTEQRLRVHRARVVRLAKVSVKNDGDAKVMCSFNIEALALEHVTEIRPIAPALSEFLAAAADSIGRELTDDPAHVSGLIKLPEGVTRAMAAERLSELATTVDASLLARSESEARRLLGPIFGPQIDEIQKGERRRLRFALGTGDGAALASVIASPRPQKARRSFGS